MLDKEETVRIDRVLIFKNYFCKNKSKNQEKLL